MNGIVVAVDEQGGRVRVEFPDRDNLISDWLPVGQKKTLGDFDYWLPDEGTQVACLMDANYEAGVVLCAIYSDGDSPPVTNKELYYRRFKDGSIIQYDRAGHKLTVDIKGEIDARTTGPAALDSQGQITVKSAVAVLVQAPAINMQSNTGGSSACTLIGNLEVQGDIHATGEVADGVRPVSGDRAIYDDHDHYDPQGGTVGKPNQRQ